LQTGQETDFILVSCTGSGIEPGRREQVLKAKKVFNLTILSYHPHYLFTSALSKPVSVYLPLFFQAGEESLRRSGLGYTIVRPGPLQVPTD